MGHARPSGCVSAAAVFLAGSTLAAQPANSVAWVSSVVWYPLEPEELDSLTPAVVTRLEAKGMTLNRAARRFESPELPLVGFWFALGTVGRRYMTDQHGYLRVPGSPPATNVKIYAQPGDQEPAAVLPRLALVPEGQEPSPTLVVFEYRPIPDMSPQEDGPVTDLKLDYRSLPARVVRTLFSVPYTPPRSCELGCSGGCCLDYNGPDGNNVRYRKTPVTCGVIRVWNFIDSTCYGWTFFKPVRGCLLERAILQFVGPPCVTNHKYRYCQSMDEKAFTVSPATPTIASGEKVELTVRNRTPGNTTCVSFNSNPGGAGVIELKAVAPRVVASAPCGGYELEHFDDRAKRHIAEAKVTFKAPVLPAGLCEDTFLVDVASAGNSKTSTIKVTSPGCVTRDWSGSFECGVEITGPGYTHHEAQRWELQGKPRIEGPRAIYKANWSANGAGSYTTANTSQSRHAEWSVEAIATTEIVVFTRASDHNLVVKQWSAQKRVKSGLKGYQQLTVNGKRRRPGPINGEAFERQLPVLVDTPHATRLIGEEPITDPGREGLMQPAGAQKRGKCSWNLSRPSQE